MKEGRFPTLVAVSSGIQVSRMNRRNEGGSVSDPRYIDFCGQNRQILGRNEGGSVSDPR